MGTSLRFLISLLVLALALAFPATAQQLPVVGVFPVAGEAGSELSETLRNQISRAILDTGKFRVLSNAEMDAFLAKHPKLRNGGSLAALQNAQIKAGIDYSIYAEASVEVADAPDPVGAIALGGAESACRSSTTRLHLFVRIGGLSSNRRRSRDVFSVEGATPVTCGEPLSFNTATLAQRGAEIIGSTLRTAVFPIRVISLETGHRVWLDVGEKIIASGDILYIYTKREPRTPGFASRISQVRVEEVFPHKARATVLNTLQTDTPIAIGDEARADVIGTHSILGGILGALVSGRGHVERGVALGALLGAASRPAARVQYDNAPFLPWPPPKPTSIGDVTRHFTVTGNLGDIARQIRERVTKLGYDHLRFFRVDGGFAVTTDLERFLPSGQPAPKRWTSGKSAAPSTFGEWVNWVIGGERSDFRIFAFIVSDEDFEPAGYYPKQDNVERWQEDGRISLGSARAATPTARGTRVWLLVYEFDASKSKGDKIVPDRQGAAFSVHANYLGLK